MRLGIDVGGTFTDLVLLNEETGTFVLEKTPTTVDVSEGILDGINSLGLNLSDVRLIVHGTTVAVNALIQNKGVKTGLITTKGFKNVYEIHRGGLQGNTMYNLFYDKPKPFVPTLLRREITERMDFQGNVLSKLNIDEASYEINFLKNHNVAAIAICFLHSYANSIHEKEVADLIRRQVPEAYVSVSSDVAPEWREYERTSTTVINATIGPLVARYLKELEGKLRKKGFTGPLLLTQSNGAASGVEAMIKRPVVSLFSGPAGGMTASVTLGKALGLDNIVCIDPGGTSFDVGIVYGKEPLVTREMNIELHKILVPALDIHSIGAGGGSIAWVDEKGSPRVGPQSAGANPGPVCYGKGGEEPTVTDANLVLGRVNPDFFIGGRMKIDVDLSRRAIEEKFAKPLNQDITEAAQGIITLSTVNMTYAVRLMTIQRGYHPKEFVIMSYGGAGGLFAADIAEAMGINQVIIPFAPAHFSAWGTLVTDFKHEMSKTFVRDLEDITTEQAEKIFVELERTGLSDLKSEGVSDEDTAVQRFVDLRYVGQAHSITIPVSVFDQTKIKTDFNLEHEKKYTYSTNNPIEVTTFRVSAIGIVPKPRLPEIENGGEDSSNALKTRRKVFFKSYNDYIECPIYDRAKLLTNNLIEGPAIVEEPAHTTVINKGNKIEVDKYGNLILNVQGGTTN